MVERKRKVSQEEIEHPDFLEKLFSGEIDWESLSGEQQGQVLVLFLDLALENPKNREWVEKLRRDANHLD